MGNHHAEGGGLLRKLVSLALCLWVLAAAWMAGAWTAQAGTLAGPDSASQTPRACPCCAAAQEDQAPAQPCHCPQDAPCNVKSVPTAQASDYLLAEVLQLHPPACTGVFLGLLPRAGLCASLWHPSPQVDPPEPLYLRHSALLI